MTRRRGTAAALLVACIWLLAGCGDDDDSSTPDTLPEAEVRGDTAVVDTTPSSSSSTTSTTTATSTYVVQSGDTLGAIAARFGVSVDAIAQANGITDPNAIQVNQELTIPPATPATTVAATTDTSDSVPPPQTSEADG
ncbi:MAG: LysM domain-containing protein [Actinomycetota bacterium]|nr:LysM domain-containing protein [Actinomycetota bacterium]